MKSCLGGIFIMAFVLGLGMINPAFGLAAVVIVFLASRNN